jgi:hypothetical protein
VVIHVMISLQVLCYTAASTDSIHTNGSDKVCAYVGTDHGSETASNVDVDYNILAHRCLEDFLSLEESVMKYKTSNVSNLNAATRFAMQSTCKVNTQFWYLYRTP